MSLKSILALLLLSCIFLTTLAQNPQTAPPPKNQSPSPTSQQQPPGDADDVVKITTNLVQVDAVVTKDGKVVKDLRAEDFELFEDGRKQEISSFAFISNLPNTSANLSAIPLGSNRSIPPTTIRTPRVEDPRRIIALVVDDLGLSAESINNVRKRLRRFVSEQLNPNDLVAIIRTGGTVGALQQFTNDRRVLDRALNQVRWNICSRVGISVFPPMGQGFSIIGACGMQPGWSVGNTLETLRFIVEAMGEMPGRKSMVVFSDSLPQEEQDFTDADRYGNRPAMLYLPTNAPLSFLLRRVAEKAIRSSVVIYGVDASGVQYTGPTAADSFSSSSPRGLEQQINNVSRSRSNLLLARREGAELIAKQTGGFLVKNSNDFDLDRIMEDQSGYYLLGYRPTDETFNRKFHHLKARVKKSGMSLRTRFGFFGVSEEEVARFKRTPTDKTTVALMSPFGAKDLNVNLTALFTNDAKGSLVRSFVFLNANEFTFNQAADGTYKSSIQLRTMLFGNNGAIVDQSTFNRDLSLSKETYEQAVREGILLQFDTPVRNAGSYQLRVAARDIATSRIGTAGEYVLIPNLNNKQLALSGILLGQDETSPTNLGTTARRYPIGTNVRFAFQIYNAVLDSSFNVPNVNVQAHLYRDGKLVLSGPAVSVDAKNQPDLARLLVSGAIRLNSDLEPGAYYLQVVAKDLLAKEKDARAVQWIDFEIVK